MSKPKDPAFLFYPGDYLQDTQNLSEKTQVSYDRIMCEHMRNICISKQQLKFFTKRLSEDELEELLHILVETDEGYQIEWVNRSIVKRRAYSESRRNNRISKPQKKSKNISSTYVPHMVNEDVNENKDINKEEKGITKEKIKQFIDGWNKIKGTRIRSSKGFESNLEYWLEDYTVEEILQSVTNSTYNDFYKDKLTPEMLLRKKDQNRDGANRIEQFLNEGSKSTNGLPMHLQGLPPDHNAVITWKTEKQKRERESKETIK